MQRSASCRAHSWTCERPERHHRSQATKWRSHTHKKEKTKKTELDRSPSRAPLTYFSFCRTSPCWLASLLPLRTLVKLRLQTTAMPFMQIRIRRSVITSGTAARDSHHCVHHYRRTMESLQIKKQAAHVRG